MIEIIVVAIVGGLAVLFAKGVHQSSERNYRPPRRNEPQESPPEFVCVSSICIPSRGRNLTGYQPRTAEEQEAIRSAMEWTDEDQKQLAAGYEVDRITNGRGWDAPNVGAEWSDEETPQIEVWIENSFRAGR